MAQLATVTIGAPGKKPISVVGHRYGSHGWGATLGLTPVSVKWRMPVVDAAAVLAEREVEITFRPADGMGPAQTWRRVVVVGEEPSDDPETRVVVLSDVRWYLLYVHLIATYNRRVYSGQRFLTDPGTYSFAVAPATDQITYALPTLRNDGSADPPAWTAAQMIDDVLTRIQKLTAESSGIAGGVLFRDLSNLRARGKWNPSDVSLDAAGNVALGQALGSVGGVDVRVAPDGFLEIVDAQLGAERSVVEAASTYSLANGAGPGATPKGVMRLCAMNHVAPSSFEVAYTRELEVRADAWEQAGTATPASLYNSDAPWAETVVRVADLKLNVEQAGVTPSTYFAVQSTVLPVDAWCAAVARKGDAVNAPPNLATITRTVIQEAYFDNLLSKIYAYSPVDTLGPSRIWTARIGMIHADYRNLFRLNPRFARRCVPGTIVAKRCGLLNPATGERQPSPVYRDYFAVPTQRGLANQERIGDQITCIPPLGGQEFDPAGRTYSDTSFPDQPFPLESAELAPFSLNVEDSVNGVFRLSPTVLPGAETTAFIPGLITQAPGVDTFSIQKEIDLAYLEYCNLIATDRVTFVFSAVPVGPNGESQTQVYEVPFQTALARLGVSSTAVSPQGPKRTIRIGDGVQRARVAWTDTNRQALLGAFMTGQGDPAQLVPVNDKALYDYAVSCSAVYAATVLDHYEGTQEIAFTPGVQPVGSLQSVEHVVTATGELYTVLHASHVVPPMRPESFMSQSSRNALFGNLGGSLPA